MISCKDRPRTPRGLLAIPLDGWTGRAPASAAVPRFARGMTAEASRGGGRQGRYFASRWKAGPARRRKIAPVKPLPDPATPALSIALEEGRAARASRRKGYMAVGGRMACEALHLSALPGCWSDQAAVDVAELIANMSCKRISAKIQQIVVEISTFRHQRDGLYVQFLGSLGKIGGC
jgi:hypothetical protein